MTPDGPASELQVRPATPADSAQWRTLYRAYADFYGVAQSDAMAERVWSWIHDPDHEVSCLVVEDAAGRLVGSAHYRPFARPLSATVGCFLDDLFVDPSYRGGGAADLLLHELAALAARNGWSVVRWITADDNYRGRGKYDRYATRTTWVTYDMAPASDAHVPPTR